MEPFLFAPLTPAQPAPPPVAGVLFAEDFDLLDLSAPFAGVGVQGSMVQGLGNPFQASPGVTPVAGPGAASLPDVPARVLLTEADLEEARRLARAEGAAAALAVAERQAAQSSSRALEALASSLGEARAEGARLAEAHAEAVARLVMSALAATLPAACAQHGEAEVRALVGALLPHLAAEPQVVIRCSPHDAEGLRAELDRLGPDAPATAQVIPTDAVSQGDVRVTWQGGGATRDARRAWDAVRGALAPLGLIDAADVAAPRPMHTTKPAGAAATPRLAEATASVLTEARASVAAPKEAEMEDA